MFCWLKVAKPLFVFNIFWFYKYKNPLLLWVLSQSGFKILFGVTFLFSTVLLIIGNSICKNLVFLLGRLIALQICIHLLLNLFLFVLSFFMNAFLQVIKLFWVFLIPVYIKIHLYVQKEFTNYERVNIICFVTSQ